MPATVHIVGAGIAGLATALALQRAGLNVQVFESAPALQPVGAGILLAINALQVFQQLGIRDQLEQAGHLVSLMKITNPALKPLSVTDLRPFEKKYGVRTLAIHRAALLHILANAVGEGPIHFGKRLSAIENTTPASLHFEDQTTVESQYIIGADGIKSVVRNQWFQQGSLRNANQLCWRGICNINLPPSYRHEVHEAWGRGKRFGFVYISDNTLYWYALVNSGNYSNDNTALTDVFREFHPDVLRIIAATPKEQIILTDIMDLKPMNGWYSNRVCLVGDAAHATTPNLGQGACQAIEDAWVLGKLLGTGLPFEEACRAYENQRRKKAHRVVNSSWFIGKLAHIQQPPGVRLRNLLLTCTPDAVSRKQMAAIFNLD